MAEYIEREALIAKIKREIERSNTSQYHCEDGTIIRTDVGYVEDWFDEYAEVLMRSYPTADVAPVVWVPVLGFNGLYEVSSLGRVRNQKGEIMKQGIKRTNGTCYKSVRLWKDGKYHTKYIHRLVAEAFIPNPDNLPFVNHKDEDGTNNFIDNLEWCTREYNVSYGTAKERRAKKIRGVPHTDEHKQKISDGLKAYYTKNDVWNKGKRSPNCGSKMDEERR